MNTLLQIKTIVREIRPIRTVGEFRDHLRHQFDHSGNKAVFWKVYDCSRGVPTNGIWIEKCVLISFPVSCAYTGNPYCSRLGYPDFFLGDANIGESHNNHFLFLTEDDAKAYVEHLKDGGPRFNKTT